MRPIGYLEKLVQMARIGPSAGGAAMSIRVCREAPRGVIGGSPPNDTFRLTHLPSPGDSLLIVRNGAVLRPTVDYSVSAGLVTFSDAPIGADWHLAYYLHTGIRTPYSARRFHGNPNTDEVDWGNSSDFNLHGDMALAIWMRLDAGTGGLGYILGREGIGGMTESYNAAFCLLLGNPPGSPALMYYHQTGATRTTIFCPDGPWPSELIPEPGYWYFLGFSRDATAKTVKFYIAKVGGALSLLNTSYDGYDGPTGGTDPSCNCLVGNHRDYSGHVGPNVFQEHYIWNRKLTQVEFTQTMAGKPPASGLMLSCRMGDNPEVDESAYARTGTVTDTTLVPAR